MLVAVFGLILLAHHHHVYKANAELNCNYAKGSWLYDASYPLYDSAKCPFIEREYHCIRNGRPDLEYLKYRWQPAAACNIKRFDGRDFLERLRGKSIMIVGDSLSRDLYQSLLCLLYSSVPGIKYNGDRVGDVSTVTFLDFGVQVKLDRNVFLVDVLQKEIGRVLVLDSVKMKAPLWLQNDLLIFNTFQWWYYRGAKQPWDYVQIGKTVYKDINRTLAFITGLNTWAQWVDAAIDPEKTRVFFQSVTPSHYNGSQWFKPEAKNCAQEIRPVLGSSYNAELPPALRLQKSALATIKKPVTLLDITHLSQFRKDGHPSLYGKNGKFGMDCLHWCVAGVPDIWNEILYNLVIW